MVITVGVWIREIEYSDAKAFLTLQTQLEEETHFMLYEPFERKNDIVAEEKRIHDIRTDEFKEIFILADENNLVGFIAIKGQHLKRIKHCASIVIGILQEYNGKGYGKQLYQKAEAWAREHAINRFELTVMTTNKRALWLYSTVGFTVEGIRRKSMLVDGSYRDEFYMSKMF
jgi:RimJ/RimL family protein N-acetyltransferase